MRTTITVVSVSFSFLLSSGTLPGQATFEMRNSNTFAGVDAPVFDAQGIPLEGSDYVMELWGGATSDSLAPAADFYYGGGRLIVPLDSGGYFSTFHAGSVSEVPAGLYAWLQVRAWDTRLGATYEEVLASGVGGYGSSPVFYALGGNPIALVPPAPLIGLQSFSLLPVVPEPSAWALLTLGGMAVWWKMRRQQSRKS